MLEVHRNIEFNIQHHCVMNKPKISYKKAAIAVLFNAIIKAVNEAQLKEWVLNELLGESVLSMPEARNALVKCYQQGMSCGCLRVSVVCANTLQKRFLLQVA